MSTEQTSFSKTMCSSGVTFPYHLGLPKNFCEEHLPRHNFPIILVGESEKEYSVSYLANKHRIIGVAGWGSFVVEHGLIAGDNLSFRLIDYCKFKVDIMRASRSVENEFQNNKLVDFEGIIDENPGIGSTAIQKKDPTSVVVDSYQVHSIRASRSTGKEFQKNRPLNLVKQEDPTEEDACYSNISAPNPVSYATDSHQVDIVRSVIKKRGHAEVIPLETNEPPQLQLAMVPPFSLFKLPCGWHVKKIPRRDGQRVDMYYIEPGTGKQFRSLKQVERYVNGEDDHIRTRKPHKKCHQSYGYEGVSHESKVNRMIDSGQSDMETVAYGGRAASMKPFTLPDGWFVEEVPQRTHPQRKNCEWTDKYYHEIETGRKFRSMVAVQRYLAEMENKPLAKGFWLENRFNVHNIRESRSIRKEFQNNRPLSLVKQEDLTEENACYGFIAAPNPVSHATDSHQLDIVRCLIKKRGHMEVVPLEKVYVRRKYRSTETNGAYDTDSAAPSGNENSESALNLKSFEDFKICVNGETLDSEIPVDIRVKYYKLCSVEKRFLHDSVVKDLTSDLVVSMIQDIVSIAESTKATSISTSFHHLESMDKTLKYFEDLGMTVGALRAKIGKLIKILKEHHSVMESTIVRLEAIECERKAFMEKKAKIDELIASAMVHGKMIGSLEDNIDGSKEKMDKLSLMLKEVAGMTQ